jgi:translocation and assembly module TamB
VSRRVRIWLRIALGLAALLVLAAITGVLILRSDWFRDSVRRRIITEIETATGGRAEIGSFDFDWSGLTATIRPLVLHGKEGPGEPPLLRVESAQVVLRIISALRRKVDLTAIRINGLSGRVVVYPDGSTNFPVPHGRTPSGKPWAEELIDLAVGQYEITNGSFEYDGRNVPINVRGRELRLKLTFDRVAQRYLGELSSERTHIEGPGSMAPLSVDASAKFAIEKARIVLDQVRFATKESHAEISGVLDDVMSPHGVLAVKATGSAREIAGWFRAPGGPQGEVTLDGQATIAFGKTFEYRITGRVNGHRLAYSSGRLHVKNAVARAEVLFTPGSLTLTKLDLNALGSNVKGQATLTQWRDFHVSGEISGLSIRQAANVGTDRAIAWNGILAGPFDLRGALGQYTTTVQANLAITPVAEGTPLQGHIDIAWDQKAGLVRLGHSWAATPATRVDVSGTLGQSLEVLAQSTDLNDVLPALAMAGANPPQEFPVKLQNGRATASGVVTGPLTNARFTGQTAVTNAVYDGHLIPSFTGSVTADSREIRVDKLVLDRGATRVEGQLVLTARNGAFEDAGIAGQLTLRNASVAELTKEFQAGVEVAGTASGTFRIAGTLRKPEAQGTLQVDKPVGFGEQIDRLTATLRYTANELDVTAADATAGTGKLHFIANYKHAENDWKNGSLKFDLSVDGLNMSRVATLVKEVPTVDARVSGKLAGVVKIVKGEIAPEAVNGDLNATGLTYDKRPVGDATAKIETQGNDLKVRATARVRGVTLNGEGNWKLEGDDPGSGSVVIPRINLATINELRNLFVPPSDEQSELPFEGYLEGSAKITLALRKPADFRAEVTLAKLQVNAKANQALRLGVQPQDVVLTNEKPVTIELTSKGARVTAAQFTGRDTSIEVSGGVGFGEKSSADLNVRGAVNLVILQLFNPALLARGNAAVMAQVRGSIVDPLVSGRMELQNASLYLGDLPNGIDKANGVVLFDRNRATIERLTAETGGGIVKLSGFLEFGSTLVYRLQADATQVRVRYPEDVSTTFNAVLSLNGTSDNSTLSGSVTVIRSSFTPRADLGQILSQASKPAVAAASPDDYLAGMKLAVRIETSPNFEFETALTRDLHADADLRLRGTAVRPVLLGTVSINQGEVQMFGNKYTVNRGEIRFLNPVKLEPTFDMDLETKARGIVVNISFSGTAQKLNVNYSSDPPLQSREIIALLATGRDPKASAGLASSQVTGGGLTEVGNGLLGQAVAQQLSSRVQRFFGASRVKIDPQLGGVENLPQARLTIEQQVSKDITLTYITNLNRTQEQLVRIEYDFSKTWSAVAVREGNGLFGIDFQYRKRFK